jgi:hypothetical protein
MTSSMHGIAEPIHLHAQPKSTNAPFLQTYVTSHAVASTAPEGPLQVVRSSRTAIFSRPYAHTSQRGYGSQ